MLIRIIPDHRYLLASFNYACPTCPPSSFLSGILFQVSSSRRTLLSPPSLSLSLCFQASKVLCRRSVRMTVPAAVLRAATASSCLAPLRSALFTRRIWSPRRIGDVPLPPLAWNDENLRVAGGLFNGMKDSWGFRHCFLSTSGRLEN